jgi:hypothetical protein
MSVNGDLSSIDEKRLLSSSASSPSVVGWTVVTSGPFVLPVTMGLFGMVSPSLPRDSSGMRIPSDAKLALEQRVIGVTISATRHG